MSCRTWLISSRDCTGTVALRSSQGIPVMVQCSAHVTKLLSVRDQEQNKAPCRDPEKAIAAEGTSSTMNQGSTRAGARLEFAWSGASSIENGRILYRELDNTFHIAGYSVRVESSL